MGMGLGVGLVVDIRCVTPSPPAASCRIAQLGQPSYTPNYQYVAAMQNVTAPGSVNDGCLAAYPPSQQWRCFMAQYTLPHITTPLFMTQVSAVGAARRGWRLHTPLRLSCARVCVRAQLPTQDQDDSWQMSNIFQLPCEPYKPGSCNATMVAALAQYRCVPTGGMAAMPPDVCVCVCVTACAGWTCRRRCSRC